MPKQIYLSCAQEDHVVAFWLESRLKAEGFQVVLDRTDVRDGSQWEQRVKMLFSVQRLLLCCYPLTAFARTLLKRNAFGLVRVSNVLLSCCSSSPLTRYPGMYTIYSLSISAIPSRLSYNC